MSSSPKEVELERDVNATLIPHGEEFTLGRGEKVTITHRLGGNFTVMTLQGMYRIAAKDADALGESSQISLLARNPRKIQNLQMKIKLEKTSKQFLTLKSL